MALTQSERAKIRMYLGWSSRFLQIDVALEQAMNAVDTLVDTLPLIQNPIDGTPPGFIAVLESIDAKILAAHNRLKADEVGSIVLNREELKQLYREGARITSRLATLLGVSVINDIWNGRISKFGRSGNKQVHG